LMTFDLLLAAPPQSPRLPHIAHSLAGTADGFLGCLMQAWAVVDPASDPGARSDAALQRMALAQLALDGESPHPRPSSAATPLARATVA
jgi:hypothetical protein